jgi:hypothetical protein
VSAWLDGVPAVADIELGLEEDFVDDDVADLEAEVEVVTAIRAPSPRNAHALITATMTRDRAAAWRRRFFLSIGASLRGLAFRCIA